MYKIMFLTISYRLITVCHSNEEFEDKIMVKEESCGITKAIKLVLLFVYIHMFLHSMAACKSRLSD